jgi:hypothetical protein
MKMHRALIIVSAVAILGAVAGMASADRGDNARRAPLRAHTAGFAVSGTYTGALSGEVTIGGRKIVIPNTVTVYRVGSGPVDAGTRVMGSTVWVSGNMMRGKPVATMIVVADGSAGRDFSQVTLQNVEADPDRAR